MGVSRLSHFRRPALMLRHAVGPVLAAIGEVHAMGNQASCS
jgi:hypothetical protein